MPTQREYDLLLSSPVQLFLDLKLLEKLVLCVNELVG